MRNYGDETNDKEYPSPGVIGRKSQNKPYIQALKASIKYYSVLSIVEKSLVVSRRHNTLVLELCDVDFAPSHLCPIPSSEKTIDFLSIAHLVSVNLK